MYRGRGSEPRCRHARNLFANGEAGGRTGAGGVDDVDRSVFFDEVEIVHQGSVGGHGLCPHAGAAGQQIVHVNLGDQALKSTAEQLLTEGTAKLRPGGIGMFPQEAPEAGEAEGVGEVA